jgi:hypothetical protein
MLGFVRGGSGGGAGGSGGSEPSPPSTSAGARAPEHAAVGFTEHDQEALATAARGYSDAHARGTGLGFGSATRRSVDDGQSPRGAQPPPPTSAPPTSALARLQQRTRDALTAAVATDRELGAAAAVGSRPHAAAHAEALLATEADARRRAAVIAAVASADVESLADALPPPPHAQRTARGAATGSVPVGGFVEGSTSFSSSSSSARHVEAMFSPPPPPPQVTAARAVPVAPAGATAHYDTAGGGGVKRQRSPTGPRDSAADSDDDEEEARRRRQRAPLPQRERELDDRFRDDDDDSDDENGGTAAAPDARTTAVVTRTQEGAHPSRSWRELIAHRGSSALLQDDTNQEATAAAAHGHHRAPPSATTTTADGGGADDYSGQSLHRHDVEPPLYTQLKLGHRVQARWAADGGWYPATVVSVTHAGYPNAVYALWYDNFGGSNASAAAVEHGLGVDRLRRLVGVDYTRDPPPLPVGAGVSAGALQQLHPPGSFLSRLHARTGNSGAGDSGAGSATAPPQPTDEAAAVDAAAELLLAQGHGTGAAAAAATAAPLSASAPPPLTGVLRTLAGCLPDERFSGGVGSGKPLCGALAAGLAPHLAVSGVPAAAKRVRSNELCPRGDHCKQKHAHPGTLARLHARAVQRAGELQRERAAAAEARRRASAVAALASLDASALAAPGLVPGSGSSTAAAPPAPAPAVAPVPAPPVAALSLTGALVRGALMKPGVAAVTAAPSGAPSWRQRLAERAGAPAPGKG